MRIKVKPRILDHRVFQIRSTKDSVRDSRACKAIESELKSTFNSNSNSAEFSYGYHFYRAITSADRSVAAPGAVFKTQPPGETIQLEIAIALVECSCSVISRVRRQCVTSMLNVFGFAAIDVCRETLLLHWMFRFKKIMPRFSASNDPILGISRDIVAIF